jgi:hypothetical protein
MILASWFYLLPNSTAQKEHRARNCFGVFIEDFPEFFCLPKEPKAPGPSDISRLARRQA